MHLKIYKFNLIPDLQQNYARVLFKIKCTVVVTATATSSCIAANLFATALICNCSHNRGSSRSEILQQLCINRFATVQLEAVVVAAAAAAAAAATAAAEAAHYYPV